MAPFIPQGLINPDLNLFFALLLGIAFGYVLEQAGFSSSKKLAGVFYGYDFVVLRVFFTAGITAMTGLMFFAYLGWVDMALVYINPTYLQSALLGGAIMGFGFIMGGFCPGTSIVGAVIGKIDAMVFIGGMFLGLFVFGHFYHFFEPIHTGGFLGSLRVYDALGISQGWFALILIVVALLAFAITQMIEDRVNKTSPEIIKTRPSYVWPATFIVVAAVVFLWLPPERRSSFREISPEAMVEKIQHGDHFVSTHRVIHQLKDHYDGLILIDTRPREEYEMFTLPGALHIPAGALLNKQWKQFFRKDPTPKVFFGNGEAKAMEAWMVATRAGYEHIFVMNGGLNRMFSELFVEMEEEEPTGYDLMDQATRRFLREARIFFLEGGAAVRIPEARPAIPAPEDREVIPVIGGC